MKEFRPRLPESEDWKLLIDTAREYGAKEVLSRVHFSEQDGSVKVEKGTEAGRHVFSSESKRIKTLDDLLDVCEVDPDEYSVEKHVLNSWEVTSWKRGFPETKTNHQVKAWLKRLYVEKPSVDYWNEWLDNEFKDGLVPYTFDVDKSGEEIVVSIADLHVGGLIEEELVPNYNIEEVGKRLAYIDEELNTKYQNKRIHVKFLGDFIESFTGKNHKDTWLQIEQHGAKVALTTADLIVNFLKQINVVSLDIIGGNHDRITAANDDDTSGQVAELLAGMIERMTEGIPIRFHRRVLTSIHDNICYIITHGDKKITKMEPAKMILEYGKQDLFNVMINAHGHEELIHGSSVKYQSIQIPPVTVPNRFALDIGRTSPSGFVVTEKSPRTGIERYTHSL